MTKEERIRAVLKRESVDRVPIALWRHFPKGSNCSTR